MTDIRYFIKNRGNPHFRLTISAGAQLWSASVNGAAAVPVSDGTASLIPLPQSADPNAVLELDLKLAAQSGNPEQSPSARPSPTPRSCWRNGKLSRTPGQRLVYQAGSLLPSACRAGRVTALQLTRLFERKRNDPRAGSWRWRLRSCLALALALPLGNPGRFCQIWNFAIFAS